MSQAIDRYHPLYGIHRNMLNRCYREKHHNFKHYGARGITVCPQWRCNYYAFAVWALKNGWLSGLEIDRIDTDGPYSPENCRITTHTENVRNSRAAKLTHEDVAEIHRMLKTDMTQVEIASHFPVERETIARIGLETRWSIRNVEQSKPTALGIT